MNSASMGSRVRSLRKVRFAVAALFLLAGPQSSHARDLTGRLGVGFNNQFSPSTSAGVEALSFRYALARDLGAELVAGYQSGETASTIAGLKLMKNMFMETSLNFYFALGVAYAQVQGESGMEFSGTFGTQFFIPGVESVGFSTEAGAGMSTVGGTKFRTMGLSFLSAGVHFYL